MKNNLRDRFRDFLASEEGRVGVKAPLTAGVVGGSLLLAQAMYLNNLPNNLQDLRKITKFHLFGRIRCGWKPHLPGKCVSPTCFLYRNRTIRNRSTLASDAI